MASNSETGHATNLYNFKLIHDTTNGFGGDYNPSNVILSVAQLLAKWTDANNKQTTLINALGVARPLINAREILFEPLNKTVTRVVNMLKSTQASAQIKKDVKGLADKIRGFKVKAPKLPDGNPDPDFVSQAHLSYVMKQEAFAQLLALLDNEPLYAPNEVELQLVSLHAYSTNMKNANDGIGAVLSPVETARVARNIAFYHPETGLVKIALDVKDYVKGASGAASEEAKLVKKIPFRTLVKIQ